MHTVIGEDDAGTLADSRYGTDEALALYREMVRARRFDERAVALQRRGWMSGYPPFRGQEAAQVGAAAAMDAGDVIVPTYRSNAMQIARGVPMSDLLLFRRGHAEFHSDHDVPVFPQAVPIGSQIPHGVGAAMAADHRDEDRAAVVCFGDGATSEGDFHEGLNFAGVFDSPAVLFCENNGWAISLPRARQTASDTIAAKADAYGFDGVRVDGNDPLAVRAVVADALAAAREGEPTLVEALTYRQGAHTTADDPDRYRDAGPELPDWRTRDPLDRFESFLRREGVLDDETVAAARGAADEAVAGAVEAAEAVPAPDPDELFDPVFAEPTPAHERQRAALEAYLSGRPEE